VLNTVDYGQDTYILWFFYFMFVIVHQTISIQLCHVTLDTYTPFTRIYLLNFTGLLVASSWSFVSAEPINAEIWLIVLTVATVLFQWTFVLKIISEITTILKIRVFRVKPTSEDKKPLLESYQAPAQKVDEEKQTEADTDATGPIN